MISKSGMSPLPILSLKSLLLNTQAEKKSCDFIKVQVPKPVVI